MDLEQFIRERGPRWSRLERLLGEVESLPDRRVGLPRLQELIQLYRQACSDLNESRSYTANPDVLGRLNDLTGRGYRFVYRRPLGRHWRESVTRFFRLEAPRAFRRERLYVLAAAGAMVLGIVVGFLAVVADPGNGERLIPAEFFTESPRERVERLEKEGERIDTLDKAAQFGAFLYTHNIQVSFLAFSLGALTILGGVWILFYNGVILGAVAGMYAIDGVHVFFLAWVGPHGALELPAIVFGGAAGLRLGRALLIPGSFSSAAALREAFPSVWRMMLTTALILVVAGIIEGSFSQFTAKTFPYPLKIGVAGLLFVSLFGYLFARRVDETEPA